MFVQKLGHFLIGVSLFLSIATVQAVEFTEMPSATSGLNYVGESWGASWGDVNGDRYPDIFASNHRARPSIWRNNGDGTFTDIVLQFDTSYTWIDFPIIDTHGGAWADFDNDGDQDLLSLTGNGNGDPAALFVNDGVGITTDESVLRGIPMDLEGRLATWMDYDADGLLDFVINNRAPNIVVNQDSQNPGNFTDQTTATGLKTFRTNFSVLTDLDNDDQFELLAVTDGDFPAKVYDIPYLAGTPFTDLTSTVPTTGLVLDSVIADLDNDLLPDIFLVRGNLRPVQALKVIDGAAGEMDKIETFIAAGVGSGEKGIRFQANGPITVTISSQLGLPRIHLGSTGYIPIDTNSHPTDKTFQLDPTLLSDQGIEPHDPTDNVDQGFFIGYDTATNEWVILNSPGQKSTRAYFQVDGVDLSTPIVTNMGLGDMPVTPKFFKNSGAGFTNISGVGLSQAVSCISAVAGDFDNDMDLDLYLVCRNGIENIVNRLYLNNGDGSFIEAASFGAEGITGVGLVSGAGVGENVVIADYDLDGWLDLYVMNGLLMNPIRVGGPDQLFRNTTGNTSTNHWIQLDLVGTVSNRDAIGAKVLASAGGQTQVSENNGNYHRWSQNFKRTHFGLAQNTTVDIEVRWPNGDVDTFVGLAADQLYEATQGLTGSSTGSIATVSAGTAPSFPAPQAGNECGVNPLNQPVDFPYHFDPEQDQSLFVWKDCATTGDWFVRATAGNGTGIEYDGLLLSSEAFALVTPFDVEVGNDIVDNTTDTAQIDFFLRGSGAGVDGFDFTANASAGLCLTASSLPVNGQVLLGKSHLPVSLPLDLNTLKTCVDISAVDISANEADGVATFTVSLSEAVATTVTVDYSVLAGTAIENADYSLATSTGSLTFNPGELSKTVDITLLPDMLAEGPETLSLILSGAAGAFVFDNEAILTIIDNQINPCGVPVYDRATEKALFVWQDCATGEWTVRATSGGDSNGAIHTGSVESSAAFASVSGFSIEGSDLLDNTTDPARIDYLMKMFGTGEDGFQFTPESGSSSCFRPTGPAGVPVLIGQGKSAVTGAFDLATLGPCLDIAIDDVMVSEADAMASFTVTLSAASSSTVSVDYVTQAGTAIADADYTDVTAPTTVTFAPGETSKIVDIAILQDSLMEGNEVFTVNLTQPVNAMIVDASGQATITDDELGACGVPVFDSAIEKALFVWKDCQSGEWFVRNTGGGDSAGVFYDGEVITDQSFINVTAIDLEASDTLDNTTDPTVIDFYLKIWNQGVEGFQFTPTSDAGTCLELTGPAGVPVLVGPTKLAVSTPFDLATLGACTSNPVDVSINDVTVSEADATASFTVSLAVASGNTVSVDYVTQAGTATADADYTTVATPVTLTFAPGETSKTIDIAILQDSLMEGDETFSVALSNVMNGVIIDASGQATITDDELGACGVPVFDSATEKALFVWKDCQSGEWFVRNTGGGDSAGVFYDGEVVTDQSFSNVTPYKLKASDILDNTTDPTVIDFYLKIWNQGVEGFQFTPTSDAGTCLELTGPAGVPVLVGPTKLAVSTPFDLATLGTCTSNPVDVSINDVTVSEADATASFTVSLAVASGNTVSVDYVTQAGTATADADYTTVATPVTLTFAPGETSKTIDIAILQDSLMEGDETFSVALSNVMNGVIIDASGQATITDDELGACGVPVFDSATEKALFVWKDCQSGEWFVRNTGGGDSAGVFYDGEVVTDQSFSNVTPYKLKASDILDNTTDPTVIDFYLKIWNQGVEGFQFTPTSDAGTCLELTGPAGVPVLVGPTKLAVSTPFDLATLGACTSNPVDVSINDVTVSEADATASFTVSLAVASGNTVSVDYVTQAGTATADADYTTVATPVTLTFAPGETSKTIDIAILQDSLMEGDETFSVALSNVMNGVIIDASGQATITDDELGACGVPVFDSATEKALFVWKDCQSGEWFVRNTGGGDSAGVFYDGEVVTDQSFSNVTPYKLKASDILDNTTDPTVIDFYLKIWNQGVEGFQFTPTSDAGTCLELTGPAGVPVLVGPTKLAVSTPFDLATLGACTSNPVDVSINDVTVSEADATASFTVSLAVASGNTVSVDYVTQAGTATADADYTTVATPVTLTFAPGETSKTIDIAILQDSLMEGDETFSVALSNVMNGVIIDASGQATITDDEPSVCGVPSYDKANEQVMLLWKDCQTGAWSVRATGGGAATTVSFVGDVVAGQDILSISGFSLEGADTLDNTTDSKRIHFVLKVAGTGQDGYQFTPATDAGTCFDLQNPGIPVLVGANRTPITGAFDLSTLSACTIMSSISIDDVTVSEADATASFTVSLSAVSNDAVIIDYVTQAGTATADTDYTHVDTPITLTFAPGETSKTIDIAILQDMLVEDVENFTVKLSNATAATLADTTGIATIIDDEVNACGQPSFIPSIDQAVYLWRDCGTDNWHLAATAGGTATQIIYLGDVTSDQPLTNINPVSIEVNDILDSNSDPAIVDFSLKMKNTGSDGFDFTTSNGTNTCFTVLPASQGGGTVIVGAAKTVFTAPFDLETLGACQ